MRILYVFPHPDDESYGPGPAIVMQRRAGHDVHLLTLTSGGATKQRLTYDYSVEEMGEVRAKEMQGVRRELDLTSMEILDLPDSGFKEMDPRQIETPVADAIRRIRPDVVVTYAVHGISGYHDHLIIHGIVKRLFVTLREELGFPKRLALFTISDEQRLISGDPSRLSASTTEEIDCVIAVDDAAVAAGGRALDCYATYAKPIEQSRIREVIGLPAVFELFGEAHHPHLTDLTAGL